MKLTEVTNNNIKLFNKEMNLDDIPAKIIGSICNLEIIPSIENSKKKEKCSISKKKLLENYKNLITTYESKKNNK